MIQPRISLLHPTGNPFARQAAIALWEAHALQEVITCLNYAPSPQLDQLLQRFLKPLHQELERRRWLPPTLPCTTYPQAELQRIALLRSQLYRPLNLNPQTLADRVYAVLDRKVAQNHLNNLNGVYAYEDGAASTFSEAKKRGVQCFYDLPIVHYRHSQTLQQQEVEQFPQLAPALQSLQESPEKLARKDQEIALADLIFVPSTIVKQSLINVGVTTEKIIVLPFGSPHDYFLPQPKLDSTFRALFVGRVGPRKGVHYLLQAWQDLNLPDAELSLIGFNEFPPNWLSPYQEIFHYIPSIPHHLLAQYYTQASVFVFPSLIEGLALVLLEAMSCGIPIITTPNSGGSDIITDGVEGFIIPSRDINALQDKLEWCYRHPDTLQEMGIAARQKAESLNWGVYREGLMKAIQAHYFTLSP
ncbi:glycosyltransferase family 4 protein [Spirulina subsalsa FACHB-351]|uniref:Glycosyltransferase family 4 protein n=1 Tax=Spirulina subsalsa FACHB-351 TaxID=234711 RepID=A0ABT3L9C4_9CYAN|nr:glycosyltransferase family 4 protein [Spirulina subsalsa]MCW6038108.1 glycosyltransferase family 4 protein [Spirulina subsalsa FACHB-351]